MSENSIISKELKNKREIDNEQQRNQLVDRNRDKDCGVDFLNTAAEPIVRYFCGK